MKRLAVCALFITLCFPLCAGAVAIRTLPEVVDVPVTTTDSITIALSFNPLQVIDIPAHLRFSFGGISAFSNHRIQLLSGPDDWWQGELWFLSDPGFTFPRLVTDSLLTLGGGDVVQSGGWQMAFRWLPGRSAQEINDEGGALINYVFIDGDTDQSGDVHSLQLWATDAGSAAPEPLPLASTLLFVATGLAGITARRRVKQRGK